MHKIQMAVDFIYLDNLFICTSSDMFDIIPITVAIITIGIKNWFIKFVIIFVATNK